MQKYIIAIKGYKIYQCYQGMQKYISAIKGYKIYQWY